MSISSQTALLVTAIGNLGPAMKNTFYPKKGGLIDGPAWTDPEAIAFSATPVFDASLSNVFHFATLGATAVTSTSFVNGNNGQTINVRVVQDATGGRAFPLPGNVTVKGAMDTSANAVNWLVLTWKSTDNKWEAVWS